MFAKNIYNFLLKSLKPLYSKYIQAFYMIKIKICSKTCSNVSKELEISVSKKSPTL